MERKMEVAEEKTDSGTEMQSSKDLIQKIAPAKLGKDFGLSESELFFPLKEGGLDLGHFSQPKQPEEDFDKVELPCPFVEAAIRKSQQSLTENSAPTFNTSDDPRVDFFFQVMEQTPSQNVIGLLQTSWKKDPLQTLKLIGSLRDIKDGKGIRQQYQICLYWLYLHHPITLFNNLPQLLKLGYWKDALQMLIVILFEGLVHPHFAFDDGNKKQGHPHPSTLRRKRRRISRNRQTDSEKRIYNKMIAIFYKLPNCDNIEKISKKDMNAARLRYARDIFANSTKYRIFHVRIAQIFAEQLAQDLNLFQGVETKKNISLAAKWAPTLEGHFDRYTLIASTISLELSKIMKKDFLSKSIPTAVYLARKFYNKEVCVPIRAHLELPEIQMSNNDWGNVNYKRVAAKCMQKNKAHFIKHDKERLTTFLTKPDTKVAGATLKPIEIIRRAMAMHETQEPAEKIILEKQWTSLVDDIKKKGSLMAGAVCVCDVSGSMAGDPMLGAIGLTLLTMAQTRSPWNEICITFHESPCLFNLSSDLSLLDKVRSLKGMPWGGTTDFQATLELILSLGMTNHIPQADMPKTIFVFTDMEFNCALRGVSLTNFEFAKMKFHEQGYTLPTIIFWNLRGGDRMRSTPVQKNEAGALLLSGFSGQLLSLVMNQTDLASYTPWKFIEAMLDIKKYEDFKIYD